MSSFADTYVASLTREWAAVQPGGMYERFGEIKCRRERYSEHAKKSVLHSDV